MDTNKIVIVTVLQCTFVSSTVKIKRHVPVSTLSTAEQYHREEPYIDTIRCKHIKEVAPLKHMLQMIHQNNVLNVNLCLYISSSETEILYSVIVIVKKDVERAFLTAAELITKPCMP